MQETNSLKALASLALERLERNKPQNQIETTVSKSVSAPILCETKSKLVLLQLSSLPEEYEERLAIAEYDGLQNSTQAERIAYLDAFMAVLATLPYEDIEGDWLAHRVNTAQEWLVDQDMSQPK